MDTRSKYRSLDAKGAADPPMTRERHNSVPTIDRRKDQQKRTPDSHHRSTRSHASGKSEGVTSPDAPGTRHSASSIGTNSAINLLVLGSPSSGKSTFIRNALGRERSRMSTEVVVKDKYYRIRLIEASFDDVDFSSESTIEWPAEVNGAPLPDVDGVFCLYDVADKESVADIPAALSKSIAKYYRPILTTLASMTNTGVPCMLVAAKCDVNEKARQVSSAFHEQVRRNLAKVAIAEISIASSENTKQCFMAMVHRVIATPRCKTNSPPDTT
jgi:GTPase SAR1 family protein